MTIQIERTETFSIEEAVLTEFVSAEAARLAENSYSKLEIDDAIRSSVSSFERYVQDNIKVVLTAIPAPLDAYTKDEVDAKIRSLPAPIDAYTKDEVDAKIEAIPTSAGGSDPSSYTYSKAEIDQRIAASGGGSGASFFGGMIFDRLAATDNERVKAANAVAKAHGGKPSLPFIFSAGSTYTISVPFILFSGLTQASSSPSPAREYSRHAVIKWTGPANSSIYVYPADVGEVQTNQGYPSDGSPRDISITGIMWDGSSGTDVFPRIANDAGTGLRSGGYTKHTLWYVNLHNCGVKNMRTLIWGWGTGLTISGSWHIQAMSDTPILLGGSENTIFADGVQSFIDNTGWETVSKPFIRSVMEKSTIGGSLMPTARGKSWQMSIEGGNDINIVNVQFDSQSEKPVFGANLRISGGTNILVTQSTFKGGMTNPAAADGGEANNRGYIHITGGTDILIEHNSVSPKGSASTDTPLVYVGGTASKVRIGLNRYGNNKPIVRQSSAGRIVSIDPTVQVVTG